jgi:hypothetical protein
MPIYARRKDGTHRAIVEAFIACGWSVMDVSRAPYVADLIVSRKGRTVAVEVKSPGKKPMAHQQRWMDDWQGECAVLTSVEQVVVLNGGSL